MVVINKIRFAFFLIVLISNISGCFYNGDPDYKSQVRKIPPFLVNHFPGDLQDGEKSVFIRNTDTTSQCIYYMLVQYGDQAIQRFQSINTIKRSLGKYAAADKNIVAVKRETVGYWDPAKKRNYNNSLQQDNYTYPIPFFEKDNESSDSSVVRIYSDNTISGLSEDFTIDVFDFKPGKYWKGLKPVDYMPKKWENGFSKGVSFSPTKKVVIYWFVVW